MNVNIDTPIPKTITGHDSLIIPNNIVAPVIHPITRCGVLDSGIFILLLLKILATICLRSITYFAINHYTSVS